jgi:hypothetical protein
MLGGPTTRDYHPAAGRGQPFDHEFQMNSKETASSRTPGMELRSGES